MCEKKSKIKKGFSILEVVFAFAILELGLLAIIGSFPSITKMNKEAWKVSIATQSAQQKIEEVLQGRYDLYKTTYTAIWPAKDYPRDIDGSVRSWWFEPDPEDKDGLVANNDIWIVKVKVEWPEGFRKRSVMLASYYYLYNPAYKPVLGSEPTPTPSALPGVSPAPTDGQPSLPVTTAQPTNTAGNYYNYNRSASFHYP